MSYKQKKVPWEKLTTEQQQVVLRIMIAGKVLVNNDTEWDELLDAAFSKAFAAEDSWFAYVSSNSSFYRLSAYAKRELERVQPK